jgi:phosphorylase kinase alpha/beta subunit
MIGELEHHHKRSILADQNHIRVVNKIVKYLESIQYWQDSDSGIGKRMSSACIFRWSSVAGLESIKRLDNIEVPQSLIDKGRETLN